MILFIGAYHAVIQESRKRCVSFPWNALNVPLSEIRVMSAIRANKPGEQARGPTMNRTCPANGAARYAMRQDGEFYARP